MFRNYPMAIGFKIAWRNLVKNKVFSFINIGGLSIGISSALVIFLLIQYDFSFDKFERDNARIYRVVTDYTFSGVPSYSSGVPHAMPPALKNNIAGLDEVVPFRLWDNGVQISVPEKNNGITNFKKQKDIVFADESYFRLLSYQWLEGSPGTSLQQPYQTVLTQSKARLFFPGLTDAEIVGKEINFNDTIATIVTGIVKDLSYNTDFTFKTFISRATIETPRLRPDDGGEWSSAAPESQLFVKLSTGTTAEQVQNAIENLFRKNYTANAGAGSVHHLQPLSDVHFNAVYDNFNQRTANRPTLYGLMFIAVFLLVLACINFINLTTAQSSQRAKEIGVRKTMGSSKRQLVFQFLSETFLLTLAAAILSIVLIPFIIKIFANFIPAGLHFNLIEQPGLLLFFIVLIVVVCFLSGLYPAIILSSYKPVLVLKKVYSSSGKTNTAQLRKILIVSQFVIAQVFIIATIVVGKQIHYVLGQNLGFQKNAVINFNTSYTENPSLRFVLLDKLKSLPGIASISLSNNPPTSVSDRGGAIKFIGVKGETEALAQIKYADTAYINLYQIRLIAGKNLPVSDTLNSLLINETCARTLGFQSPRQAVGKYLDFQDKKIPVIGVVQDFHQKSLHEVITPLIVSSKDGDQLLFNIALQPQNNDASGWRNTIAQMQKAYREVYPKQDFEYQFLDDSIAKYYTAEENISRLLSWATALAIVISCLGLFGFAIYVTNQKTKEIGIRKVLGATSLRIASLLSKDFLQLVLIAFSISMPVAWIASHNWLNNFAYRTSISWWIFVLAGMGSVIIALVTISFQSIKAAIANPVKSLRTE